MASFKSLWLAAGIALAPVAASTAHAEGAYGPRLVHLAVVDRDTGAEKPVYYHDRRYFVAGESGRRYSLRVVNETDARVLVVLSVDGVNVLTGETAGYLQRGYILSPHESADINGWRKSLTEIAAFRFAPLAKSYAARTGRPDDVGVIGMAVFRERYVPPPPPPPPPPMAYPGAPAPMPEAVRRDSARADMAQSGEKLGTAHGERETDVISEAPFERATNRPEEVRLVEYDSTANLIAAGVIPRAPRQPRHPRGFPKNHDTDGFVPDPPPG